MKLERMTIGGRNYHSVNGKPIRRDTLETIANELFAADIWQDMRQCLTVDGSVNIDFNYTDFQRNKDKDAANQYFMLLQAANRKIAALEEKIAELTIKNIYLQTA